MGAGEEIGFPLVCQASREPQALQNIVFNPRFHDLVDEHDLWLAADDVGFTEGPVMLPEGYIIYSNISGDAIMRYSPPSWTGIVRKPSGGANGNTLDPQGRLVSCEGALKRVTRTEPDGSIIVLASMHGGRPLNAPNDVVVKNDGAIYFTDPHFLGDQEQMLAPSLRSQDYCGVFMISPDGEVTRVTTEISLPNGLALSPDETVLYVVNSGDNCVYAFDVDAADGSIANKRLWLKMDHELEGVGDGMKVDLEGNAYVTGPGGVWVVSSDGTPLGIIPVPHVTTNVAFYGYDSRLLFITAPPAAYVIRIRNPGISVIDRIVGGRSYVYAR